MASEWNEQRENAAQLVAKGELSEPEIAKSVGVARRTLQRWKIDAAFRMRVEAILDACAERSTAVTIASKTKRLEVLDECLRGLLQVKAERAVAPEVQSAPGGKTGFVVRTVKSIRVPKASPDGAGVSPDGAQASQTGQEVSPGAPSGDTNRPEYVAETTVQVIEEFAVDGNLSREIRGCLEQAAREMGEWQEKPEAPIVQASVQVSVAVTLAEAFTPAELEAARERLIAKAKAAGQVPG